MTAPNRVYTFEFDSPDDDDGAYGVRHAECVDRTDVGYCNVLDDQTQTDRKPEEDIECWGCDGWLHEPPLTVEQTAALHAARREAGIL